MAHVRDQIVQAIGDAIATAVTPTPVRRDIVRPIDENVPCVVVRPASEGSEILLQGQIDQRVLTVEVAACARTRSGTEDLAALIEPVVPSAAAPFTTKVRYASGRFGEDGEGDKPFFTAVLSWEVQYLVNPLDPTTAP